jgi:hypothetical protein
MELNSREIALLVWISLVLAALLLSRTIRPSLLGVFRALLHPKIVYVLCAAGSYAAACVWALHNLGLWEWRSLKTAILWFLTTAFVVMADTKRLEKGTSVLGELAKEAFAITAIVTFIGSINTLPLWGELLLLPAILFVAAIAKVAEQKLEHRSVATLANSILSFAGFGILFYSCYEIHSDWRKFDAGFQTQEFFIPVFLTLMFLPFLYGLMLFMAFENAAIRLGFSMQDRALRRFTWFQALFYFGASVGTFRRFIHAVQVAPPVDRDAVSAVVSELRAARRREKHPSPVNFDEGWSPYLAKDFLAPNGLPIRNYDPSTIDWSGNSEYLKLTEDVLPDHLVYRIAGRPIAVTELELEMDVRNRKHANSDQAFWSAATKLVLEALGNETAERFAALAPSSKAFSMEAGAIRLEVKYDDWSFGKRGGYSRTLVVHHPAHRDPFLKLS